MKSISHGFYVQLVRRCVRAHTGAVSAPCDLLRDVLAKKGLLQRGRYLGTSTCFRGVRQRRGRDETLKFLSPKP